MSLRDEEIKWKLHEIGLTDEEVSNFVICYELQKDLAWLKNGLIRMSAAVCEANAMSENLKALMRAFPSWDVETLIDTLREANNDVDLAGSLLVTWTSTNLAFDTIQADHGTGEYEEDEAESSNRSDRYKQQDSLSCSPEPITSMLPPLLERREYDSIMIKKLVRKSTPSSMLEALKAAARFKARLSHLRAAKLASPVSPMSPTSAPQSPLPVNSTKGVINGPQMLGGEREQAIEAGKILLNQRLTFLGLRMVDSESDGSCLFRSLSREMFGTQAYHSQVRKDIVEFMRHHDESFSVYFVESEWIAYLESMSIEKTWGDELTLRAAADNYQVSVHVVTSESENWYLRYEPEGTSRRAVFLSYISPIHYTTFVPVR